MGPAAPRPPSALRKAEAPPGEQGWTRHCKGRSKGSCSRQPLPLRPTRSSTKGAVAHAPAACRPGPRPPRFHREDPAGSWMKGTNLRLLHPSQPTASTSLPGLQARAQQPRLPEGKNSIFPKRLPSRLKRGCSVKPSSALSLFFIPIKSLAACLRKLYTASDLLRGCGTSVPSGWPRGTCLHEDNGPS